MEASARRAWRDRKRTALLLFTGLAAGICNGMLGSGGGLILWLGLSACGLCRKEESFPTGAAAVLGLSLVSATLYLWKSAEVDLLTPALLPALFGGWVGARLLGRWKTEHVKKLFAGMLVFSGILLFFR